LRRLEDEMPNTEFVLVSTCNRTELYAAGARLGKDALSDALVGGRVETDECVPEEHFYAKTDVDAAEHLLRVACGMDSMVVGETEIIGQVKQAYMLGVEAKTTGRILNPLFQKAFRAAKRVHTETDVSKGRVSVSSIAVDFAEKVFDELSSKTVMIVGAGETSELTLKNLVEAGVSRALILNRSFDKARSLAGEYGGEAVPFDRLEENLSRADIVISSTNSPHPVIRAEPVRKASAARHGRPLLLIDIAVPRDIDDAAGDLENVYLYNIDDLQEIAAENLARRQDAVKKAAAIIGEETAEAASLFQVQDLGSLMKQLDESVRKVKESELERAFAREKLRSLPESSREEVRLLLHRTVNQLLAPSRDALRDAARNGRWDKYSRIVKHLFGLDRKGDE
jgi:glutamyl-tRNA reductase